MSFGCGDGSWKGKTGKGYDEMSKVGLGYEKGWLGLYNSGPSNDVSQYMYLVERVDCGLDWLYYNEYDLPRYSAILTTAGRDSWGGARQTSRKLHQTHELEAGWLGSAWDLTPVSQLLSRPCLTPFACLPN